MDWTNQAQSKPDSSVKPYEYNWKLQLTSNKMKNYSSSTRTYKYIVLFLFGFYLNTHIYIHTKLLLLHGLMAEKVIKKGVKIGEKKAWG